MNPVFPLQALRAFTEVGRHGSIKLAAQESTLPGDTLLGNALSWKAAVPRHPIR